MALVLSVGDPSRVLRKAYARKVIKELGEHLSGTVDFTDKFYWSSGECAWSAWEDLQDRALELVPRKKSWHLRSMEAWNGVYLPVKIEPAALELDGEPDLDFASSLVLFEELSGLGPKLGISLASASISRLRAAQDVEGKDAVLGQLFAELFFGTQLANEKKLPLWIVK